MGSLYNGVPGNIAYPGTIAIASSTATTPIQVTTSTAHDLFTGDLVDVQGHLTNTAANGIWQITVLSTTSFSLTGAVGTAAGSGGTVQPLNMGNTAMLPADGDPNAAATFTPGYGASLDRVTRINVATGAYKLANILSFRSPDTDSNTAWATNAAVTTPSVSWSVPTTFTPWVVPGVVVNDVLDLTLSTTVQTNALGPLFAIMVATQLPGAATPSAGSYAKLTASNKGIPTSGTVGALPVTLNGITGGITSTATQNGATYYFTIGFFNYASSGGASFSAQGDWEFVAKIWRPTSVPQ